MLNGQVWPRLITATLAHTQVLSPLRFSHQQFGVGPAAAPSAQKR